jgi:hypothetical protein
MRRSDKGKSISTQKRRAQRVDKGYKNRGTSKQEERSAWATVNMESSGGKKSGSSRAKGENRPTSRKGSRKGGTAPKRAAARSSALSRSRAAKKGWQTRRRHVRARQIVSLEG